MNRALVATRIHLINKFYAVGLPLGVLAGVLVLNLVIAASAGGGFTTGGITAVLVVVAIYAAQAMTQVFPFALGIGLTRREFFTGTALHATGQALLIGLVLTVGALVERVTGGWGLGLGFFRLGVTTGQNPLRDWAVFTAALLVSSAFGTAFGAVFQRWGLYGMYAVTGAVTLVVALAAVVIGSQGWWPAVGEALVNQPLPAPAVVYPTLLALFLGGAGWSLMRRATP